jgi:type II secretory pathway pseudopilin PulG
MNDLTLIYLVSAIVGLLIAYFLFRWMFAIDKRIKQNESIINLLTILAKKQGATNDDIKRAKKEVVTSN